MEGIVLVAGPALAGAAAWFALPPRAGASRSSERYLLRAGRALERIADLRVVRHVAEIPQVGVVAAELRRALGARGISLSGEACAGVVAVGLPVAALAGLVFSASPVGLVAALVLYVVGMGALTASVERRQARELAQEMPEVFRTLASALGSGETLPQAIEYVARHGTGRAAEEFGRTSLVLTCGESVSDALEELAGRLEAPGMRLLVSALDVSQRTGSPLEGLLGRSARMVERQQELERLLGVKTAQVRLSVRIVCVMPLLLVAFLAMVSPDFQAGVATPGGLASVVVALLMDGAALLVVRRLMKGVL